MVIEYDEIKFKNIYKLLINDYSFYIFDLRKIIKVKNFNKIKKIFIVSTSDLLLYHQLNNGLIDYNLYFNGLDNKKFNKYFSNDLEILLIFDFLNNPYNKNFVKKDIYNDNIRLFSNMLYSNDLLSLNNNSNKTLFLKLYSKKIK